MNNLKTSLLLLFLFLSSISFGQGYKDILRVKKNNRWGAIDRTGRVVIPAKYEYLGDFNQHGIALFRANNKYGAVNIQSREILPAIYDDVRIDSVQGIIVAKDGKWGILQPNGKQVFSIDFDKIIHAPHGHFWLWKEGKKGVANSKGVEVVPVIYDEVHIFSPQRFIVQKGVQVGLLDDIKGEILGLEYDSIKISSSIDKTIRVYKHGKSGLTSWEGKFIIEPSYKDIQIYPSQPYYRTFNEDRHVGLIEKHGKHILDTIYRDIRVLPNGRIMAKRNGKWEGLTAEGKVFTKAKWNNFEYFSEDYLILKKNHTHAGLFSFEKDSLILDSEYVRFEYAFENYIRAYKHGGSYLIHPDGKVLTNTTYSSYIYLGRDLFGIKQDKNWGIMTKDGKVLLDPVFERIYAFPKTLPLTLVINDGKYGLVNTEGKMLCQTIYDKIEVYKETQRAKAKKGEVTTIFEFNKAGRVVDSYKFEKVISLSVKSSVATDSAFRFVPPSRQRFEDSIIDSVGTAYSDAQRKKGKIANFGTYRNKWIRLKGTWIDTEAGGHYKNVPIDFFGHNIARVLMKVKYQLRFSYLTKRGTEIAIIPLKQKRRTVRHKIGFLGEFSDSLMRINLGGKLHYQPKTKENKAYSLTADMETFDSQSLRYQLAKSRMLLYDNLRTSIPICSGGTWGFLNRNGGLAIPPIYEFVQNFRNGQAIAKKGGKWGVINTQNEIVIPFKYDLIDYLPDSDQQFYLLEIHGKKHGFVDALGRDIIPTDHDHLNHFSEGIASVKSGHLWGFVDKAGRWIAKPIYLAVRDFGNGLAAVRTEAGWGYINTRGNIVIEPQFIRAGKFNSGLAPVKPKRGRSGFIDIQGNFVIEPQFDRVSEFKYGRAMVKVSQKDWGMIDTKGNFLLQPKYKRLEFAQDSGYVLANQNYMWGLCDLNGDKLTGFKYKKITSFSEGLAAVQLKKNESSKSTFGYINRSGKLVIPHQFKKAGDFKEGFAVVSSSHQKYYYINKKGVKVFNLEAKKATPFSEGKAIVWMSEHDSRFINTKGEEILKNENYRPLKNFQNGRAIVLATTYNSITKKTHHGQYALDSLGNLLPTSTMTFHTGFQHGVSFALKNGKYGLVDINGVPLSSFKYDGFAKWHKGLCRVYVNRLKGIANLNGELVAEPKFHHVKYLGLQLFKMERADELGYLTSDGKWLWEVRK